MDKLNYFSQNYMTNICVMGLRFFNLHIVNIWQHSRQFLSGDENYFWQINNIANFWHSHTFRKETSSVADIAEFSIGPYVGLYTCKNLALEMLTPCRGDQIKCPQVTNPFYFVWPPPFTLYVDQEYKGNQPCLHH